MSTILDYIKTDESGRPIQPLLILGKRDGTKLGGIPYVTDFTFQHNMNSADEISFDVTRTLDGQDNPLWDEIIDFRLIFIPDLRDSSLKYDPWFEISMSIDDDDSTVKHVSGTHLQQAELGQLMLYEVEINTEDDIARDDYTDPTVFYNPDKPKASLLNRILSDKAPHYSVEHVDESLKNIQRTFSFSNRSIYDSLEQVAKEIDCLFVFGEHTRTDDNKIHRTISAYDLEDYCSACGERGNFPNSMCTKCSSANIVQSYGQDTNVFISKQNLADSVSYENDTDSVKNCFRLTAGDDLMTATVRNINPNGTNYIYYITSGLRAEMSKELQAKLENYQKDQNYYTNTYTMDLVLQSSVNSYNTLVDKYKTLNENLNKITYPIVGYTNLIGAMYDSNDMYAYLKTSMAPGSSGTKDTTAKKQVENLTSANLSPVGFSYSPDQMSKTTADYAVKSLCAVYVNTSRYKVQTVDSAYSSPTWTGCIKLTNYTDDDDTATSGKLTITLENSDSEYIKQLIQKTIARKDSDKLGAVALFQKDDDDFKATLRLYSLDNLKMFQSICTAAKDVLTQQNVAQSDSPLYSTMYVPYYNKGGYIQDEIKTRQDEIRVLGKIEKNDADGLNEYMEKQREFIAQKLDLKTYLGGGDLWEEFSSYRRQDEYTNDNYISDGLTNAELIKKARQFYQKAYTEIIKSATLQNTISGSIKDFLLMPEFAGIKDYFQCGNWIHFEVDGQVYKLRIIGIKVDYSDLDNIYVDFSNVINALGTLNDVQSILNQAKDMATSYSSTAYQASKGASVSNEYYHFVQDGLALTTAKIVNAADEQDMVYDEHGLLMRRHNDFNDDYGDEQTKIISNGIYYTKDKWKSVQAALGHFKYYDPETSVEKDGYGVIANTLVGNLILGNNVGIYNNSGTVKITDEGLVITSRYGKLGNENLITVQRDNGDGTYSKFLQMDSDGNLVISGDTIKMSSGDSLSVVLDNQTKQINLRVAKDGVISAINASSESISISSSKININGVISANGNFKVDTYGNLTATNATFSGTITGSTISGNSISGGTISGTYISGGTISSASISAGTITGTSISSGTITGAKISGGTISGTSISGGSIYGTDIAGSNISTEYILKVGKNNTVGASVIRLCLSTSSDWSTRIADIIGINSRVIIAADNGLSVANSSNDQYAEFNAGNTTIHGKLQVDGDLGIDYGHQLIVSGVDIGQAVSDLQSRVSALESSKTSSSSSSK